MHIYIYINDLNNIHIAVEKNSILNDVLGKPGNK